MKKNTLLAFSIILSSFLNLSAQTPYIYKVYDFQPAPGQAINNAPLYVPGDTKADMIQKAEDNIKGQVKGLISLGGYGGYVVFGFDHMVVNLLGKNDFKIWGNAYYSASNPNPNAPIAGSSEPGIVMVSYDANSNGLPDDPWYELAGSEYHKPETIKNYRLTYYRPDSNHIPTPHPTSSFLTDTSYVRWTSNQGDTGYVARNIFHSQSYFPEWITADSLVFEGSKLANNYRNESGQGNYYVLYTYAWGYADNHPNDNVLCEMNIEWAVDSAGTPVHLPGIHFVKVYTGVNQYCNWLGESSTEIMGAEDLHLTTTQLYPISQTDNPTLHVIQNPVIEQLHLISDQPQQVSIYNLFGTLIFSQFLDKGTHQIQLGALPSGIYVISALGKTIKFVKK